MCLRVFSMMPSPDGSKNALLILRLLEEELHIVTLPRLERVAARKRRARKSWDEPTRRDVSD